MRDCTSLLHLIYSRPTYVKGLTPHKSPQYSKGLIDASEWGIGGVWFPGTKPLAPFVLFFVCPAPITDALWTD